VFGIGLGEILLILLAVFLISPKEIPVFLRKIGQFFNELDKLKREMLSMKGELDEIISEARKADGDIEDFPPIKVGEVELIRKKKGSKGRGPGNGE
jgi:Sec-independent protein translocase protein TatA